MTVELGSINPEQPRRISRRNFLKKGSQVTSAVGFALVIGTSIETITELKNKADNAHKEAQSTTYRPDKADRAKARADIQQFEESFHTFSPRKYLEESQIPISNKEELERDYQIVDQDNKFLNKVLEIENANPINWKTKIVTTTTGVIAMYGGLIAIGIKDILDRNKPQSTL